jgi:hypothetical protein
MALLSYTNQVNTCNSIEHSDTIDEPYSHKRCSQVCYHSRYPSKQRAIRSPEHQPVSRHGLRRTISSVGEGSTAGSLLHSAAPQYQVPAALKKVFHVVLGRLRSQDGGLGMPYFVSSLACILLRACIVISYNASLNANRKAAVITLWVTLGPMPAADRLA